MLAIAGFTKVFVQVSLIVCKFIRANDKGLTLEKSISGTPTMACLQYYQVSHLVIPPPCHSTTGLLETYPFTILKKVNP